MEKIFLLYI